MSHLISTLWLPLVSLPICFLQKSAYIKPVRKLTFQSDPKISSSVAVSTELKLNKNLHFNFTDQLFSFCKIFLPRLKINPSLLNVLFLHKLGGKAERPQNEICVSPRISRRVRCWWSCDHMLVKRRVMVQDELRNVISPLTGGDNTALQSSLDAVRLLELANENLAWSRRTYTDITHAHTQSCSLDSLLEMFSVWCRNLNSSKSSKTQSNCGHELAFMKAQWRRGIPRCEDNAFVVILSQTWLLWWL